MAELERLCGFLGVEFSERMFDYAQHSTYGLPDARLTYQWKRKMKPRDLSLVEGRIGQRLVARGYELSGLAPRAVGPLRDGLLHLVSRASCLRNRVVRFGFPLVVQELLSRRLSFRGWNRAVQARIDAIVDAEIR